MFLTKTNDRYTITLDNLELLNLVDLVKEKSSQEPYKKMYSDLLSLKHFLEAEYAYADYLMELAEKDVIYE